MAAVGSAACWGAPHDLLSPARPSDNLRKLLPWLLGKKPKGGSDNSGEAAALIDRLKLHYVGMTRPSHLLCLARRKDTFKPAEIDLMRARNWRVIECVAPAPRGETIDA